MIMLEDNRKIRDNYRTRSQDEDITPLHISADGIIPSEKTTVVLRHLHIIWEYNSIHFSSDTLQCSSLFIDSSIRENKKNIKI